MTGVGAFTSGQRGRINCMADDTYATQWSEIRPAPSGLLNQSRELLRNLTISVLSRVTQQKPGPFLRAVFCHHVFDDQKEQFEVLIRELKSLGTFVDTDTCVAMLKGNRVIDSQYFHLSFDDGFRNAFQNAVPVLKDLGVPAIFFVPTGFVGTATNFEGALVEKVNWDELRTMISWGFEVGSHTRNHARLSDVSRRDMLEPEIYGSKADLEDQLGVECKYMAWPYGTRDAVDDVSLEMTRRAGYRACFGGFRGTVVPNQTSLYSIPRHHFEVQWPVSHVRYFSLGNMERGGS